MSSQTFGASGNRFGLTVDDIEKINRVFARFPQIEKVEIYGSRAKGNFRPASDIDLTVFSPTFTNSELLQIQGELDDLNLPYKIDLSLHHLIENSALLDHIARVGLVFF